MSEELLFKIKLVNRNMLNIRPTIKIDKEYFLMDDVLITTKKKIRLNFYLMLIAFLVSINFIIDLLINKPFILSLTLVIALIIFQVLIVTVGIKLLPIKLMNHLKKINP